MEAANRLIMRMGSELEQIIRSAQEISYYSRGGWPYETVLRMTQAEREMAVDFINKRLELAAKSAYPVY